MLSSVAGILVISTIKTFAISSKNALFICGILILSFGTFFFSKFLFCFQLRFIFTEIVVFASSIAL